MVIWFHTLTSYVYFQMYDKQKIASKYKFLSKFVHI